MAAISGKLKVFKNELKICVNPSRTKIKLNQNN